MEIVQRAYDKYGDKLALSFNGGKESIIVLRMIMTIYPSVKVFYVRHDRDFPEIIESIDRSRQDYQIDLLLYDDLKSAITDLKDNHNIEAILTGFRRSDPYGPTEHFQLTDNDWPQIVRVSPLLNWSYSEIWDYIIKHDINYCRLYDRGYTSIGTQDNTFPNHLLFNKNGYSRADDLSDGTKERIGRIVTSLPIILEGRVIKGKGWGNKMLRIPTANLDINLNKIALDEGVYYGTIKLDETDEKMFVMSCGINPQFGDQSFEVHIIDIPYMDLYNTKLRINVTGFIRPMERFDTIDMLKNAIRLDIEITKMEGKRGLNQ